jgi:hypothetical protein
MRWAGQRGFADRVHRAKATWPGPGKVHLRFAAVRYRAPATAGSERPEAGVPEVLEILVTDDLRMAGFRREN